MSIKKRVMSPWYAAYTIFGSAAFMSALPLVWVYSRLGKRFSMGWRERLGFLPTVLSSPDSPIWIHASSLGEVRVAGAIMTHLRNLAPESRVMLSVTTDHGFASAKVVAQDTPVVYAPLDFLFSVRRALSITRPKVMVFLETEIWPAWIAESRRKGIKCALINGRISPRSLRWYRKFSSFFREVLDGMDVCSMITEEDRERIVAMGADPGRVEVHGNAKYDLLSRQADPSAIPEVRRLLNLVPSDLVFVAGSTREGEEEKVLDVYEQMRARFPGIVLILAPRHIARASRIESLLRQRGLYYQLRTRLAESGGKRTAPVLVLDTFGELFNVYSVGTINFCGGSLVPLGGQNPMEAAVWGKAVFYGPSMEDFLDAKRLLEKEGAGIEVKGVGDFSGKALRLLDQRDRMASLGERARRAVLDNQGAAEKHAKVIARLL
jgi:3-deoxy-D-manno-octulosonic-acid transferase